MCSKQIILKKATVYLDTCVFKFSQTQLPRPMPREQLVNWGGKTHKVIVHDFGHINPNEKITNSVLKHETDLLPTVAELGKQGKLRFGTCFFTSMEVLGMFNIDSRTGAFYGASYENLQAPVEYCGVVDKDFKKHQLRFLSNITDKRFLDLQKVTGAYQGEAKPTNLNQLLDAFHIWCAEYNECNYFLTLDFKLIKMARRTHRTIHVKLMKPSELLQEVPDRVSGA